MTHLAISCPAFSFQSLSDLISSLLLRGKITRHAKEIKVYQQAFMREKKREKGRDKRRDEDDEDDEDEDEDRFHRKWSRVWELEVKVDGGGWEVDTWRIEPTIRMREEKQEGSKQLKLKNVKKKIKRSKQEEERGPGGELDAQHIAETWGVEKVVKFIDTFRMEFASDCDLYCEIFRQNQVDGRTLLGLTMFDLEKLGIREEEHRLLILREIEAHLLACGRKQINDVYSSRVKHKSLPNSLQLDPVRVLLESIRRDIGDDKVYEYKSLLAASGVATLSQLLSITDQKLLQAGIKALGHRKLMLARTEIMKLLPLDELQQANEEKEGKREHEWKKIAHPLQETFSMTAGPSLANLPKDCQEFKEANEFFSKWYRLRAGTQLEVEAVQRVLLSPGMIEKFNHVKSQLRNPFAPLLRLLHAGTGKQTPQQICADGFELPNQEAEHGRSLDFVGALRPVCLHPWAFPRGKHSVLLCDVAVGISWRVPEQVERLVGEWDEAAAGISMSRVSDWAASPQGCEKLSETGWMKMSAGGLVETRRTSVCSGESLCFSLKFSSQQEAVYVGPVEVGEMSMGMRASFYLQQGEWGTRRFRRFGLTLGSDGIVNLIREEGGRKEEASLSEDPRFPSCLTLGRLEEDVWYSVEWRVLSGRKEEGGGQVRLDLWLGRSLASSQPEVSRGHKAIRPCVCSHQSSFPADGEDGGGEEWQWKPAVQVQGGGRLEVDDWLKLHQPRDEAGSDGVKNLTSHPRHDHKVVPLDRVRSAGYDSVYAARKVRMLHKKKLEAARKRRQELLAQGVEKWMKPSSDALREVEKLLEGMQEEKGKVEGAKKKDKVEELEGFVQGGNGMGCACEECEKRKQLDKLEFDKYQLEKDGKESPDPLEEVDFDMYSIYNAYQALPRYLITFSIKLKEESKAVSTPCWICSEPPHKLVPAATKIFLHMAGEEVDVCWSCAGLSRVPDAPVMLAPQVSDTLEEEAPGTVLNLLHLKWTEPAAPSPILLYVLECAALPEGSDDVDEAGNWVEIASLPSSTSFSVKADLASKKHLVPGQYCFRVRARNAAGWSAWSSPVIRRLQAPKKSRREEETAQLLCDQSFPSERSVVFCSAPYSTQVTPPLAFLHSLPSEKRQGEQAEGLHSWEEETSTEVRKAKTKDRGEGKQGAEERAGDTGSFDGELAPVGSLEMTNHVQYCCAWHPKEETLWLKSNASSSQVFVHNKKGEEERTLQLPCPAICMTISKEGEVYCGSGSDFFTKLDPSLNVVWKVSYTDGPCARGVGIDGDNLYAAFNTGPARLQLASAPPLFISFLSSPLHNSSLLSISLSTFRSPCLSDHLFSPCSSPSFPPLRLLHALDFICQILVLARSSGAKLRVILVKPNLSMALSMVVVAPGLLAVSDSGRILLYRGDGSFARVISSGYLNAALAFDGKRILVGGANSKVSSAGEGLEDSEKLQVWHLFKLPEFGGKIIA